MKIQNTATTSEIAALFTKASSERKAVLVRGYVNSSGETKDLTVIPLPQDGYPTLVRASYTLVDQDLVEHGSHKPEHITKAKEEQLGSWRKYVDPTQQPDIPEAPRSKYALRKITYNVWEAVDAPGTVVVSQLGSVGKASEPSLSKDPVVAAKKHINAQTPVDEYVAQLILNKGISSEIWSWVDSPEHSWSHKLFYCVQC